MKIVGNIIYSKSEQDVYSKEKDGRKPNTERILNKKEYDQMWNWLRDYKDKTKKIHVESMLDSFERQLMDVSVIVEILGNYLVVFSWKHVPFAHSELKDIKSALIITSGFDERRELREKIDKMLDEVEDSVL